MSTKVYKRTKDLSGRIILGSIFGIIIVAAVVCGVLFMPSTTEFEKKCTEDVRFSDGMSFSCQDIKKMNLDEAYINGTLVKHGRVLYEQGSVDEVEAGKDNQYYCLSAKDTWNHVGELRCVVFEYETVARSGKYYFLNEKKDYKTGFVVFMPEEPMTWEGVQKEFLEDNEKHIIGICGVISLYGGHPQIVKPYGSIYSMGFKESYNANGESLYSFGCSHHDGWKDSSGKKKFEGYRVVIYNEQNPNPYPLKPINDVNSN